MVLIKIDNAEEKSLMNHMRFENFQKLVEDTDEFILELSGKKDLIEDLKKGEKQQVGDQPSNWKNLESKYNVGKGMSGFAFNTNIFKKAALATKHGWMWEKQFVCPAYNEMDVKNHEPPKHPWNQLLDAREKYFGQRQERLPTDKDVMEKRYVLRLVHMFYKKRWNALKNLENCENQASLIKEKLK